MKTMNNVKGFGWIVIAGILGLMTHTAAGGQIHGRLYVFSRIVKLSSGLILIALPWVLLKPEWVAMFDDFTFFLYYLLVFLAIFAGEGLVFYGKFAAFDSILHWLSGFTLTLIGFQIGSHYLAGSHTSLLLLACFAFLFAMSDGVLWEGYEFLGDALLDLNMQRYIGLSEQAALWDTMKDILCNMTGSLLACIYMNRMNYRAFS